MINRRNILTALVALSLTGCGFSLRGVGTPAGTLPEAIRIETVDPYAPFIREITRQLTDQGVEVTALRSAPVLTLTAPVITERELGPLDANRDQMELAAEVTYRLTDSDLVELIPETAVRATLIYVDSGADTSAEDQRINQLKRGLESDLLRQVVPSLRVRYEQALQQAKAGTSE